MRFQLSAVLLATSLALTPVLERLSYAGDDAAAAQALFNDGKKLMTSGKYVDACPKLEESQRLAPAIGTKFNLADCYEHTGRLASAWAAFLSVAAAAKNANQAPREKAARDRAAAIEPKLSRMAVGVPDASKVVGMEVRRDGDVIGEAEWGEAMPVDPGEHTVTVTAPGKRAWKGIVEVQGAASVAKVIVPPMDDEPVAPAPTSTPTAPATPTSTTPVTPTTTATSKTPGWVLVAAGGASLIGGGVFWAMRSSEASKLTGECGANGQSCPSSASNDISSGKTYDAVSVGLFVVGGACVVAGATWLLTAGHGESAGSTNAAVVVPTIGPGLAGASVAGRF
jgi:hypothetical protein